MKTLKPMPQAPATDALLAAASRYVANHLGLEFPPSRWADLERGLSAAARQFGHKDIGSCLHSLLSSPPSRAQIEVLANHLTVGETYFFRDPQIFTALASEVLPRMMEARRKERRLRVWSAGCSTGEEAYSLAILLDRQLPKDEDWDVTILGTDINAAALDKARSGVYGEWSFRGTPLWVRDYFANARAGRHQLSSRIRRMVTFSYLNLMEDPYPALVTNTTAMDIIFCRNVLMYFSPERARCVVEKIHRALRDESWLAVSPSELCSSLFSGFRCVHWNGAMLYQKSGKGTPAQSDIEWNPSHAFATDPVPPFPGPVLEKINETPMPTAPAAPAPDPLQVQPRLPENQPSPISLPLSGASEAQASLARAYADQGRLTDALACCELALAADKLKASSHYLRGLVLQELGRPIEALQALRRAIYLDQDFVMAHFTLISIAESLDHAREGRRHRQTALALLQHYKDDDILPESEGITAGRLAEIIGRHGAPA